MELSASGILYLERLNQNIRIPKFDSVKKLQTSSLCCLLLKYQNEYYLCLFLWLINLQKRHPPNYHCLIERRNFLVLNQHQQHPFYNFINSQIAASTYCPFCRHCLKKVQSISTHVMLFSVDKNLMVFFKNRNNQKNLNQTTRDINKFQLQGRIYAPLVVRYTH